MLERVKRNTKPDRRPPMRRTVCPAPVHSSAQAGTSPRTGRPCHAKNHKKILLTPPVSR